MEPEVHSIYIRYVDGGEALIPVPARRLGDRSFEILPHDDLDFGDDSVLFEYGPGDTLLAEERDLKDGTIQLLASRVVTPDSRNTFKRMLLAILLDTPSVRDLVANFGEAHVAQLQTHVGKTKWIYPGISNWLKEHDSALSRLA